MYFILYSAGLLLVLIRNLPKTQGENGTVLSGNLYPVRSAIRFSPA
ncbi:hypothetical protein GY50_1084 [Dehalococcoides mccartyi GY50]|nr:hypothetical protein GY50_1084 [Dehalococcoides mccartyi GY50]